MQIIQLSSNEEILIELGRRIKELRISMGISQKYLSEQTGVSLRTIGNMESGKDVSLTTLLSILRELNRLSSVDQLIPEQSFRPSQIVAFGKKRCRASSKDLPHSTMNPNWKWGDES